MYYSNNRISTPVVDKVKVNGIYQASNIDLGISTTHGTKHDIVICSVDKKRKRARVKTITSLERFYNNNWYFKNGKLNSVRNGSLLVIPKTQLMTSHLSGIYHKSIFIPLNKIHYKEPGDRTRYPARYDKLIHRK